MWLYKESSRCFESDFIPIVSRAPEVTRSVGEGGCASTRKGRSAEPTTFRYQRGGAAV